MLVNSAYNITITNIASANKLYNNPSDTEIYRHNRPRWAVALKSSGKTYYTINGKTYLSDSTHPVILPKGSTYTWRCVERGDCLIIEFDAPQELDDILSFSLSDNSFIINGFSRIQKHLHIPTAEAQLECIYTLYGILLKLVKTTQQDYVPKEKRQLLKPAIQYISEKYDDPHITNDALAAMCGISTVYFRKCFEAAYGVSPIRFLHDLRIQKAKDILSSDYASISQVAESVGCSSVYHFSKMFRLYTGLSPSQYAKTGKNPT